MTAHSMSRDEWARVKRVASDVWARPMEERARCIDEACAGDDALRAEVVSLVESMEQAGERFETPALAMPASRLAAPARVAPGPPRRGRLHALRQAVLEGRGYNAASLERWWRNW